MTKFITSNFYFRFTQSSSFFLKIEICHNIKFIRCTIRDVNRRFKITFQSDRDKKLAHERKSYRQKQIEKQKKRKKQSIFNSKYSTNLNIKECILNVQAIYLKQLVVEKNHVKEFAKISDSEIINLKKNKKEIEKVLQKLQY
jgi:hypothetical protein